MSKVTPIPKWLPVCLLLPCLFCSAPQLPQYADSVRVSPDGHSVYFHTPDGKEPALFLKRAAFYQLSEMSRDGNFVILYCTPDPHPGHPGRIEQFAVLYRLRSKDQVYPENVGLSTTSAWIGFSRDSRYATATTAAGTADVALATLMDSPKKHRQSIMNGAPTCDD